MSKRKAEQPHPDGESARPASLRGSARLHPAAAFAEEEQQLPAAASASAGAPFRRLATVELQLIMQHCDLSTLLALARCSRFTLHAASHSFAWRALSPLSFPTTVADLGANLRGLRLLAHCDVALRWLPPKEGWRQPKVGDAELAAIESVPRLVELDARAREVKSAQMRRLLSHPSLTGLTTLHCDARHMDDACTSQLPLHHARLRTLLLMMSRGSDADPRLLAPLPQLPALTDLSLDYGVDQSDVEIIGRCASLRRLHLSNVEPAVLFAVLAAPARARLESLSLSYVNAGPASASPHFGAAAAAGAAVSAADVQSWKASFENLQSLRALCLRDFEGFGVVFAGVAAALASGSALRSLTALRADTLQMDNEGGSLIPLLAAHCPQLRRLHIHESGDRFSYSPGALLELPSLTHLSDLRLQCESWPPNGDELAVGRCAALTRLHLSDISSRSLHSILRSPQLQRLESLTLGYVHFDWDEDAAAAAQNDDLDWSVCFANLRSLRALNLDDCYGGDLMMAGVQAACPPLLGSMRFHHDVPDSVVPELQLLPALLVRLPALRVELFEEAPLDGMAYRSVDKAGQLQKLRKAWHKLKREHPARVTITVLA